MTSPSPSASTPRRAPHELLGLTSPAYGGDYNPEQWDEATFAEDLELITGCPVLGQVPTDRVLAKRLALGEDPVRARSATRRAATALARELLARVLVAEPSELSDPVPAGRRSAGHERGSAPWPR